MGRSHDTPAPPAQSRTPLNPTVLTNVLHSQEAIVEDADRTGASRAALKRWVTA